MATIRFNLKPAAGKKVQIRAMFQDGSLQRSKNTGYTIPAAKLKGEYKFWDSEKQMVRPAAENSTVINALLDKWRAAFTSYKDECKRLSRPADVDMFIRSLGGEEILTESPSLISIAKLYKNAIKKTHDEKTIRGTQVIINDLQKYEAETGKTVLLHEVDRLFYKDFSIFLIDKSNNFNPTINKKQTKIVTIINWAVEDLKIKLPDREYERKYRFKEVKSPKFPLHPDEIATLAAHASEVRYQRLRSRLHAALKKLEGLPTDTSKTQKFIAQGDVDRAKMSLYHLMVLDAFLLSCETGLRHSDVCQLQAPHIKSHIAPDGIIRFIDLTNMKGSKGNNMPLSDRAAAIIDRYYKPDGLLFSFNYSQKTSDVLKKIFKHEEVNLDRPVEVVQIQGAITKREIKPLHDIISFHMARNTFATRLLSSEEIAPALVQGNLGHSKIEITMGYFRPDDVKRWQKTLAVLNKNADAAQSQN